MSTPHRITDPLPLRLARGLEDDERLDQLVDAAAPLAQAVVGDGPRRRMLRGDTVGHKLHPVLTDLPVGLWTAATVLDLVGGNQSRAAARRLVGLGLLAVAPTVATGLADWQRGDRGGQRVGVVHAVLNAGAASLFGLSWLARRGGHHGLGALVGLSANGALAAGGYLGGHMAFGRTDSAF